MTHIERNIKLMIKPIPYPGTNGYVKYILERKLHNFILKKNPYTIKNKI